MIDLQRAIELSKGFALQKDKHKHAHYPRTQELYRMYRAMVTGNDLEYLLRRFDRRESEQDFQQANRIVQQVVPAITSALMAPPKKVSSVRPVVDTIDFGTDNDKRTDELRKGLSEFYAGESVDSYLGKLVEPSDIDPNGYTLLTFDAFDNRYEKPTVYPVHIPSYNVWDQSYLGGKLEWLWLGFDIEYVTKPEVVNPDGTKTKAETAKGFKMVLYTHDHHIVYTQVEKTTSQGIKGVITDEAGNPIGTVNIDATYYLRCEDDSLFEVKFYDQKSGRVPAFRLGCVPDPMTGGATMVNRWHNALPYLLKDLKRVRELDLSVALHTFPQKSEYVRKCTAMHCNGGTLPDGVDCGTCKGDGFITIGTAQDHKIIPMPRDPNDIIDLSKLVHYADVPIHIVDKLMELVREDRSDAFKAVYGSDIYGQGNVGKTYEEVIAMNEGMYDALQPFSKWWSASRVTITYVYASYMGKDSKDMKVVYKLPRSFGYETASVIFGMMKGGREAGASKAMLANFNTIALSLAFRDDPKALLQAQVQAKFDPFPGMTEDTISGLISGGKATEYSAMLWLESATVFARAEAQYEGKELNFYEQTEKKQREVIDKIIAELLEENKPEPVDIGGVLGMEGDPNDPNADPNAPPVKPLVNAEK